MMALRIEPLPEGGVLVSDGPAYGYAGPATYPYQLLRACSTIDEALDFIRGKLAPVEQAASCEVKGCEHYASASLASGEGVCLDHLAPDCKQDASAQLAHVEHVATLAQRDCGAFGVKPRGWMAG